MRNLTDFLDRFFAECVRIPPIDVPLIEQSSATEFKKAAHELEETEYLKRKRIEAQALRIYKMLFEILNDEKIKRLEINDKERKEKLLLYEEVSEGIRRSALMASHKESSTAFFASLNQAKQNLLKAELKKEGWDLAESDEEEIPHGFKPA